MIEIEIGARRSQCLDRRIDDAYGRLRNTQVTKIKEMFSTERVRP